MAKRVQLKAKARAGSGRGAAKRLRAEGVASTRTSPEARIAISRDSATMSATTSPW